MYRNQNKHLHFIVMACYTALTLLLFLLLIYDLSLYIKYYNVSFDPSDYDDLGIHSFHTVQYVTEENYDYQDDDGSYNTSYYREIRSDDGLFFRKEEIRASEYNKEYNPDFRVIQSKSDNEKFFIDPDKTAKEYLQGEQRKISLYKAASAILGVIWILCTVVQIKKSKSRQNHLSQFIAP